MSRFTIISSVFALAIALTNTEARTKTSCNNYSTRYAKDLEGVCVCNEAQCDNVSNDYLNLKDNQVGIYSTSRCGERLDYTVQTTDDSNPDFLIETNVQYQKIIGFGGAFTDAAAVNVNRLTSKLQQTFLDAYYSTKGLEYTVGRIPIASTDFSESVYSYNDVVDDFEMKHFSIDVDRAPSFKLKLIQRALNTTTRDIKIFASSWAPPTWMTRENKTENSHMKGSPGDPYWKALALYYAKFIEAYQAEGIHIWGITVQNEPVVPPLDVKKPWQSLRLTAEEERDFIKRDLGPLMKERFPNILIIAHDDNKPDLQDRQLIYNDIEARKYISGVGIHWYKNLDFFTVVNLDFDKLKKFHDKYPDLFILGTEACEGYLLDWLGTGSGTKIEKPNQIWSRAENYGRDIINDLANYVGGWTDWNIALDTSGGPNWAGNNVDAPILIDEKSGTEFYKQPMYYVMGHFSKFLPPGSVRLNMKSMKWWNIWWMVDYVAFLTPENRIVVILFNRRELPVTIALRVSSTQKSVNVKLSPKTLKTIIFPTV